MRVPALPRSLAWHLLLALPLTLCAACGQSDPPVAAPKLMPATPTLTLRDAFATKEARDQAEKAAAATRIANSTPIIITPLPVGTDVPIQTPVLGISGCGDADNVFNYTSCWKGMLNNQYVYVNSGAPWNDQAQGTLRIITSTLDLQTLGAWQSYPTPAKVGLIRIVDAVRNRLTLRAADGTRFTFDVPTRQWVNPAP